VGEKRGDAMAAAARRSGEARAAAVESAASRRACRRASARRGLARAAGARAGVAVIGAIAHAPRGPWAPPVAAMDRLTRRRNRRLRANVRASAPGSAISPLVPASAKRRSTSSSGCQCPAKCRWHTWYPGEVELSLLGRICTLQPEQNRRDGPHHMAIEDYPRARVEPFK
jgi:hypothetical protein